MQAQAEAAYRAMHAVLPAYFEGMVDHLNRFFYATLERLADRGGVKVLAREAGRPAHFRIISGDMCGHAFDPIFLPETSRCISRNIDAINQKASTRWLHLGWRVVLSHAPRTPPLSHLKNLSQYLSRFTFRLHPSAFSIDGREFKFYDPTNPKTYHYRKTFWHRDAFKKDTFDEQIRNIIKRRRLDESDALRLGKIQRDLERFERKNLKEPICKDLRLSRLPAQVLRLGHEFDEIPDHGDEDRDEERDASSEEEILMEGGWGPSGSGEWIMMPEWAEGPGLLWTARPFGGAAALC